MLALEAHGAISDFAEAADPVTGRPTLEPYARAHARYLEAGERQSRLMTAIEDAGSGARHSLALLPT